MLSSSLLAMIITLVFCILWMRLINLMTTKGLFSSSVSRKIIHIGTGPLFVLCWWLFPDVNSSKYLAAIVPLLMVVQVLLVGLGKMKDHSSVQSMARTGMKSELLKGPLFYGIVFVVVTIFFWKSVYAVIPLMILCGGDGAADLIGSRIPSKSLPWAKRKTVIGSLAMLIGGFLLSLLMVFIMRGVLVDVMILNRYIFPLFIISLVSMVIESISPSDYDNLTVPAAALIMSLILL